MADLDPGGVVTIHAEDCGIEHGDSDDDCTCEPITLIKGAEA